MDTNGTPVIDLPTQADITLAGETLAIVENMTDKELRALVVQMYRMNQEIVSFVRGLGAAVEGMQNAGGMAGLMARQMNLGSLGIGQ